MKAGPDCKIVHRRGVARARGKHQLVPLDGCHPARPVPGGPPQAIASGPGPNQSPRHRRDTHGPVCRRVGRRIGRREGDTLAGDAKDRHNAVRGPTETALRCCRPAGKGGTGQRLAVRKSAGRGPNCNGGNHLVIHRLEQDVTAAFVTRVSAVLGRQLVGSHRQPVRGESGNPVRQGSRSKGVGPILECHCPCGSIGREGGRQGDAGPIGGGVEGGGKDARRGRLRRRRLHGKGGHADVGEALRRRIRIQLQVDGHDSGLANVLAGDQGRFIGGI